MGTRAVSPRRRINGRLSFSPAAISSFGPHEARPVSPDAGGEQSRVMGYLGDPFVHDIFASDGHGDPMAAGSSPLKEWSRCLILELIEEIHSPRPEFDGLKIFLDADLDPTKPLTEALRSGAKAAGVLLIIMSDR